MIEHLTNRQESNELDETTTEDKIIAETLAVLEDHSREAIIAAAKVLTRLQRFSVRDGELVASETPEELVRSALS